MAKVKIPYYVVRKGRGYWLPSPKMKAIGFDNVRCGLDGPGAWAIAETWNRRWQAARKGQSVIIDGEQKSEASAVYPTGSVGDAFARYRNMDAWARKAPRTREDWWRGWAHIRPVFGDVAPRTITAELVEQWHSNIRRQHGPYMAHKAMKIWRALWKVMKAFRLCGDDPSLIIRNSAPRGRSETYREGEAVRLAKRAIRMNDLGLACIIAVAWDTQFAPIDCRTACASQWFEDAAGSFFVKFRGKTLPTHDRAIEAIGTLSRRTERLIEYYLETVGIEPMPDAPLFRNRRGTVFSKDSLSRSFRRVRSAEMPGDRRQLLDFRRSGSDEANAGDVNPLALSAKMANSINASKRLQDTYLPKRAAAVRLADEARKRGRIALRNERRANKKLKLAGPKS